jgi:hypothetical protein
LVSGAGVPEHSAYPVTAADASMESAAKAPLDRQADPKGSVAVLFQI